MLFSVILYIMNIRKEHLNIDDSSEGAEVIMDACMGAISEILMLPAIDEDLLTKEDADVLTIVGGVLKTIAKKAQAYEDIFEKGVLPRNSQN